MRDLLAIVRYTWNYLRTQNKIIIMFIAIWVVNSVIGMANTFILGASIDGMLEDGTTRAIVICALTYLSVNLISFISGYYAKVNGQNTMELAVNECQLCLADHIEGISLNYLNGMGTAAFMQRLYSDVTRLVMFVLNVCAQIPIHLVTFILAIGAILQIDVVCGVAAIAEIPVIILLYQLFQKKMLEKSMESEEKAEVRYDRLHEMLADMGHSKKNQIHGLLKERFRVASKNAIYALKKEEQLNYYYNVINNHMDVFLRVFLLFYGGFSVIRGKMTVGNFMIIYTYYELITNSCSYFLNLGKQIQDSKAHYLRLKAITDTPKENNGLENVDNIEKIEFSNVYFSYQNNENILVDFSYKFCKGNLYTVVGKNGCGKSTMVSLLMGMYIDEYKGEIRYNNKPIKQLDMRKLRKEKMGVCEQEPFLLNGTIRYNMIYSDSNSEDDKLKELSYHVSFDSFLANSAEGLDTRVGKGGNALSGGQKQKTALVKVFYKNPDVLILDEPTSAMDAEGQERLIRYLNEIKKDKIIIVITHDERMVEVADAVVRMQCK